MFAGMLGKGAFGEVSKVLDTETGQTLAMKRIPMFGAFAVKTATTEVPPAPGDRCGDCHAGLERGTGQREGSCRPVCFIYYTGY